MWFVKKKTIILLLVILTVGITPILLKSNTIKSVISPLSKTFSIFSLNKKREPPNKTIYGYLPYWVLDDAKYIQYDKLTDIAYFGLHIDENGNFLTKDGDGNIHPGLNQWRNNSKVKEIIKKSKENDVNFALTIISHVDETSTKFLDCRSCWDTLKNNIVKELIDYDIKDVNLNFEYVEFTPKEIADKYTQFTKYINEELDAAFSDSKVVVASFADSLVKERVTRIEDIGNVSDGIFIMAYDFHRPNSDNAGPVAPINGKGVHAEYDIATMLTDYLSYVSPDKLILGVPYYGYNWVVEDDEQYAKRLKGTDEIGYSQSQTYANIMETILEVEPEINWDELAKTPYFTYISPKTLSTREVYFDNVDSLKEKYKLVKDLNLQGVGIWALAYDGGYTELWELLEQEFLY